MEYVLCRSPKGLRRNPLKILFGGHIKRDGLRNNTALLYKTCVDGWSNTKVSIWVDRSGL